MSANNDFLSTDGSGVQIRPCTAKDISIISTLSHEIWPECYTQMLGEAQVSYMLELLYSQEALQSDFDRGMEYYLLYDNAKPAGYLGILPEREKLFLSRLYIKSELRRHGLGSRMLTLAEQRAQDMDLFIVYLTVNKGNDRAINAYKRNGYVIKNEICKFIGGGFSMDDYVMEKNLQ